MHDSAITTRTLEKALRRSDYRRHPQIQSPAGRSTILKKASRIVRAAQIDFTNRLATSMVRGKRVNHVTDFAFELVVRKLNSNLRNSVRTRTWSRDRLVTTICEVVSDTNAFCLLRLDISSFYESIETDELKSLVREEMGLSFTSYRIVEEIVSWHIGATGLGLPRGLSISATLSDYYLAKFDKYCADHDFYFYYCRYADDILIVGDHRLEEKQSYKKIKKALPTGLSLNRSKSVYKQVSVPAQNPNALEFEYLGYSIKVSDGPNTRTRRTCTIDISSRKVARIKTRVFLSFKDFTKTGDLSLLIDRVRFITSNYKILDKNGRFTRRAGIYYSYPQATAAPSNSLLSLDKFLQAQILSFKAPAGSHPAATLSKKVKRDLLSNSFVRSFESRGIRNFAPSKIAAIQRCWKYA